MDSGGEAVAVSLDFSSAFDRVSHSALIYRLKQLGIGGRLLEIIVNFLSLRSQAVVVDGFKGPEVAVSSGVPQGSVLGTLLFILFTSGMWDCVSNRLEAYADDTTLSAIIDPPEHRAEQIDPLNTNLSNIVSWCEAWGMKLNGSEGSSAL